MFLDVQSHEISFMSIPYISCIDPDISKVEISLKIFFFCLIFAKKPPSDYGAGIFPFP